MVTDPSPTDPNTITVTLAPPESGGGVAGGLVYRVVLTEVVSGPGVYTVTGSSTTPTVTFMPGKFLGNGEAGWLVDEQAGWMAGNMQAACLPTRTHTGHACHACLFLPSRPP